MPSPVDASPSSVTLSEFVPLRGHGASMVGPRKIPDVVITAAESDPQLLPCLMPAPAREEDLLPLRVRASRDQRKQPPGNSPAPVSLQVPRAFPHIPAGVPAGAPWWEMELPGSSGESKPFHVSVAGNVTLIKMGMAASSRGMTISLEGTDRGAQDRPHSKGCFGQRSWGFH